MAFCMGTSGLAKSIQIIDCTGLSLNQGIGQSTDASLAGVLRIIDISGQEIAVDAIRNRLNFIREKSHSQLGEAWSRLAQM